MRILHDYGELRNAAAALAYIVAHGLTGGLEEWLATLTPPHDSDRRWRLENPFGRVHTLAGMLARLTGADDRACLAAVVAECDPDGFEDRCRQIVEFADAHKRHGSKFYGVLYGDGEKLGIDTNLLHDRRRARASRLKLRPLPRREAV